MRCKTEKLRPMLFLHSAPVVGWRHADRQADRQTVQKHQRDSGQSLILWSMNECGVLTEPKQHEEEKMLATEDRRKKMSCFTVLAF